MDSHSASDSEEPLEPRPPWRDQAVAAKELLSFLKDDSAAQHRRLDALLADHNADPVLPPVPLERAVKWAAIADLAVNRALSWIRFSLPLEVPDVRDDDVDWTSKDDDEWYNDNKKLPYGELPIPPTEEEQLLQFPPSVAAYMAERRRLRRERKAERVLPQSADSKRSRDE
jgi:hypothetical protein